MTIKAGLVAGSGTTVRILRTDDSGLDEASIELPSAVDSLDPGRLLDLASLDLAICVPDGALDPDPDSRDLGGSTVVVAADDGRVLTAPMPPFDMIGAPSLKDLPEIPGASVTAQYTLIDAVLGADIDYRQVVVNGQIETLEAGWSAEADLFISIPYLNYLRLRLGEIEMLEALEGGDLKGDFTLSSVLTGVLESPGYQQAWTANAEVIEALLQALEGAGVALLDPAALDQTTP